MSGGPVGPEVVEPKLPRKASSETRAPVPQTDTGRRVENTKVNGRTFVKELGKKTRRKFARCLPGPTFSSCGSEEIVR